MCTGKCISRRNVTFTYSVILFTWKWNPLRHYAKQTELWLLLSAAAAKSLQSCPTLCDPIDGSPPGSPVPGILQARTLEWVAISFSNAWKWICSVMSDSRDPMDCSPPGSSIHGVFQASVLEWGAIVFSISIYISRCKCKEFCYCYVTLSSNFFLVIC